MGGGRLPPYIPGLWIEAPGDLSSFHHKLPDHPGGWVGTIFYQRCVVRDPVKNHFVSTVVGLAGILAVVRIPANPSTCSGRFRPPVPGHSVHLFQSIPSRWTKLSDAGLNLCLRVLHSSQVCSSLLTMFFLLFLIDSPFKLNL